MKDKIEQALVSKGWIRLWIVGSAIWVPFWSYQFYDYLQRYNHYYADDYLMGFVNILGIPFGVFVSGLATRWVIRGFIS